jgi:hypothetical protein
MVFFDVPQPDTAERQVHDAILLERAARVLARRKHDPALRLATALGLERAEHELRELAAVMRREAEAGS